MAFGLMMKASYALFIFPLVFYFCVIAFKKADSLRRKYVFQNILLIFFILFIITGYRYCRIDVLRFYIFLFVCEPTNLSIGQCINILYSYLLSPIFFILFIASFFWILFYEEQMKKMIFLVWFLPAFLYHSFMLHHREIHYIVPLLPVIALMSARVLNMIRWNYIKSIVISIWYCLLL